MAEPVTVDLKEATIEILDGSGTPNTIEIKMDEGNLTWTETYNKEFRKDRGVLDSVRNGDQEPMAVSFSGRFSAITSLTGDDATLREALKGTKTGWASTGAACEPYQCDIRVTLDRDCTGTTLDEIITFPTFSLEELGGDFQAGQISVSGHCNAQGPTGVRTTVT